MKHILRRLDYTGDSVITVYDTAEEALAGGVSAEANAKAEAEAKELIDRCLAKGGVALGVDSDGKAGGHVKSLNEAPEVVLIPKVVAG